MTDIARLGAEFDGRSLETAVKILDKLSVEAAAAEVASKKLAQTQTSASAAIARGNAQAASSALKIAQASGNATAAEIKQLRAQSQSAAAAYSAAQALDTQASAALKAAQANLSLADAAQKVVTSQTLASGGTEAFNNSLRSMGQTAGQQQANMTNMISQFQDIGVTAAMGMNPMLIALQQGSQMSLVFANAAMQAGGPGGAVKLLGQSLVGLVSPISLVTIGLTAAAAVAIQYAMSLVGATDESKKLEWASNGLADVQGVLGDIMDLTTGKVKNQSAAMRDLALAKMQVMRVEAMGKASEAMSAIQDFNYGGRKTFRALMPMSRNEREGDRILRDLMSGFTSGAIDAGKTLETLDKLRMGGFVSEDRWKTLAMSVANYGMELKNAEAAAKGIESLESGNLDPALRESGKKKGGKPPKSSAEKFSDMMKEADIRIASLNREAQVVELTGEAAKVAAAKNELLTAAMSAGVNVTDKSVIAQIESRAALIGQAQQAIETKQALVDLNKQADNQIASIEAAGRMIGLYGRELKFAQSYQELLNEAMNKGIPITDALRESLMGKAGRIASAASANESASFIEGLIRQADLETFDLSRLRGEIGLTGIALAAYRYETDKLRAAKQANIDLTPEYLTAIQQSAAIYATEADAIAQATRRIEEQREAYKSIGMSVSDAFKGMLTAGRSWRDGMKGIINAVIDQLWQMYVVQQIVGLVSGALGGGGVKVSAASTFASIDAAANVAGAGIAGARAKGGPVEPGKTYLVGEEGAELFTPDRHGQIIPSGQTANAGKAPMVINVDARGATDPAAVRAQVQQGIAEAAPLIVAAAESRTISTISRQRLGSNAR